MKKKRDAIEVLDSFSAEVGTQDTPLTSADIRAAIKTLSKTAPPFPEPVLLCVCGIVSTSARGMAIHVRRMHEDELEAMYGRKA